MIPQLDWLPPLITLSTYGGDWFQYEDAIYTIFKTDFVDSSPTFRGIALRLKRYPLEKGKEATFWHLTSEGEDEANRVPDLRRCERIAWPRAIIEHADDPSIKVWENERRRGEKRVCLWLEQEQYLVVLAWRSGYLLPWTAYMVTEAHQKRKLQREYEQYLKTNTASN